MDEEAADDIDGSIHSIHVRNFFCHENLEINLNRNVNFIVGRNGSGKSAILTALVVGLGGRASATNRGNNLHSFIKKGSNSATVEIKIKNSSPKAYKHNIYGDYITIVRNINASGGSSYKVKSATGDVISTKFEEVNAIILAHDIQVDNPISVLNQDDARSFHASDAKKIYSLFRKATNLDQTEGNYLRSLENCKKAVSIWNRKNEACAELEKEYQKWKTSYEQMQSRDEIEAQKQALQNEYYWSEVAELEREVDNIQKQHDKQNEKCERLLASLRRMEEEFGGESSVITTLKAQLEEKTNKRSELEREVEQAEGEVRSLQAAWRADQLANAKLYKLLDRERTKVNDLEREMRENFQCEDAAGRRRQLEQALEAAEREAAAMRARFDTAQHDAAQARAHAAHAQQPADAAATRAQQQRNTIKQLKQQLRELESRGGDSLAVYGGHMVELCQRVRQAAEAGHFSAPPRGPVGNYLKLKEKKWGGAIEHIIGGSIKNFCVNNVEDSRKLFDIMKQVYGSSAKPGVTCSEFLSRQHDVRRSKVRAAAGICALDALHVPDPVVANFLIDNLAIETILLVAEHEDAVRLADTEENVPERCSKIVTLDGTEYHPAPNYRSYGGAARPPRFLHLSIAERKKQIMGEIEEAETVLKEMEKKAEQLNVEAARARSLERDASRALQALLAGQHERDEAVRSARAALELQAAPLQSVLMEELKVSKEKLTTLKEQAEVCGTKEKEFKQKIQERQEILNTVKPKLEEVTAACRSLAEEIEEEQLKVERGVSERRGLQQREREERDKLARVADVLLQRQAVLDNKVQLANNICSRTEQTRDKAILVNELKKVQLKLRSIRSDGLSRAEVAERLLAVERSYRRTKRALDSLRQLIDEIKATTSKHLKLCHKVQSLIARRVQHCFQSILTLRGYSGQLEIDYANESLRITCAGRGGGGAEGGARRAASTASLSGGERSYSTVAFIMALWECVELPFYFMDEFDVFMDNVNRKVVLELLVAHARRSAGRQFVFLTPQDASAVTASSHVTIHMMADPRP
ncbi:PREDICTED: structural maintenance of chromosomes protein 6-like [Papilio xuthus]|uniref:Structural maintenance of chromosomes protein 6-like n=1 Tax=Papilio xuthus TaxID=66420 RepID=A0AAJ6ZQL2_PAPXU|nr:PREDICTED: structural maintenance of chromosomes protein 6-like [Papilio xuthus]